MSIESHLLNRPHHLDSKKRTLAGERAWLSTEALWVGVTFILFMVLGPFASIAVVPAVFSLVSHQHDKQEPELIEKEENWAGQEG